MEKEETLYIVKENGKEVFATADPEIAREFRDELRKQWDEYVPNSESDIKIEKVGPKKEEEQTFEM